MDTNENLVASKSIPVFIIFLLAVKAIFSNIIYDTYTIDRILITVYMSMFIVYAIITLKKPIMKDIYKNHFFYFGIYVIAQASFSPYIKGNFEEHQQIFIGLLIILFICFTNLSIGKYFKVRNFVTLVLIASSIIALLLIIDTLYFSIVSDGNYTIQKAIIKYFKNIRVLNHLQAIIIPTLFIPFVLSFKKRLN